MKWHWIGPVILATGIVCSTVVANLASDSRWLVLAGPGVMAIAMLAVGTIDHRLYGASRARVWTALILGGALILAGLIVAQRDPALVAINLPIFGGASAVLIGANLGKGARSERDAGLNGREHR
jgi:hypothetical protein